MTPFTFYLFWVNWILVMFTVWLLYQMYRVTVRFRIIMNHSSFVSDLYEELDEE